jgi:hypothetical protein
MSERKTNRKNKTNLVMKWPSKDEYFTIKSLMLSNPEFVPITLRVRLKKAIDEEALVEEIGYKNCGKGRPVKAFAMKPVTQSAKDKALADGITLESPASVPVVQINPTIPQPTTNVTTPTNVFGTSKVVA